MMVLGRRGGRQNGGNQPSIRFLFTGPILADGAFFLQGGKVSGRPAPGNG